MKPIFQLAVAACLLAWPARSHAAANEIRLGIVNYQQLIFNLSAPVGLLVEVETSTNLIHWFPLSTYLIQDDLPFNLPTSSSGAGLFIRARRHEEPITNSPLPTNLVCVVRGPPDDPSVRDANIPNTATPIKTIRLLFQILAESGGSNPAVTNLGAVQDQVNTLNDVFRPSRLQFVHTVQQLNVSHFRHLATAEDAIDLKTNSLSPATQHNIFVTDTPGDEQGRSTFPWDANALLHGGTVTSRDRFGADELVLVHELGHALGLLHTHHAWEQSQIQCPACNESDSDHGGDRCSDTAGTPVDGSGRPVESTDRCTGLLWPTANLGNYMSAAPYRNVPRFTPQQAGRMHAWIDYALSGWLDTNTPAAPSDLIASANSFGEVRLTWTDNAWNETGFVIERAVGAGGFVVLATNAANLAQYIDLTAPGSANCAYRVRAINGAVSSYQSTAIAVPTPPEPFKVYADVNNTSPPFLGTLDDPFQTVEAAYNSVGVAIPTIIRIQPGTYPQSFSMSNKVLRLEPVSGNVILGTP